jgi:hypothetical protein
LVSADHDRRRAGGEDAEGDEGQASRRADTSTFAGGLLRRRYSADMSHEVKFMA